MKRKVIFSLTSSHSIQVLLDKAQAESEAEERREQEMETALQIQHSTTVHKRATVRVLNRELGLAQQVRNIYLGTYFYCIR
jgi:hypothetical protein